jgi:hypothetical protein
METGSTAGLMRGGDPADQRRRPVGRSFPARWQAPSRVPFVTGDELGRD